MYVPSSSFSISLLSAKICFNPASSNGSLSFIKYITYSFSVFSPFCTVTVTSSVEFCRLMFFSTVGFWYSVSLFESFIFTFDVSEFIPAHTVTLSVLLGNTFM